MDEESVKIVIEHIRKGILQKYAVSFLNFFENSEPFWEKMPLIK